MSEPAREERESQPAKCVCVCSYTVCKTGWRNEQHDEQHDKHYELHEQHDEQTNRLIPLLNLHMAHNQHRTWRGKI